MHDLFDWMMCHPLLTLLALAVVFGYNYGGTSGGAYWIDSDCGGDDGSGGGGDCGGFF
jgi:hypothetical protein